MLALLLLFVSPLFAKPNEDVKSRVGIITPKNRHHICRDWWDRRSRKFFTLFCINVWGPKLRSPIVLTNMMSAKELSYMFIDVSYFSVLSFIADLRCAGNLVQGTTTQHR